MEKNYNISMQKNPYLGLFLLLFFWFGGYAQQGTYVGWNNQVGCILYDTDDNTERKGIVFLEDIDFGNCVGVCENSTVTYTVNGADIANVIWNVSGGTLNSVSGAGDINAVVDWGAAGYGAVGLQII